MASLQALLLLLALASPAPAAPEGSFETLDASALVRILGDLGYTGAEIDADGDVIVPMQGHRVLLLLGSHRGRYLMARFAVTGSAADLKWANEWNRDLRFARVYLDQDGDPVLEAELDFVGGVRRANVEHFIRSFGDAVGTFLNRVPRR
ncbi:MAG: YbjN domain-containing protein [Xanthomonadales bacterium]|nr:YbjN domain-containing protein [Xanthomonadales bacterium]